jgi:hypothetical protein
MHVLFNLRIRNLIQFSESKRSISSLNHRSVHSLLPPSSSSALCYLSSQARSHPSAATALNRRPDLPVFANGAIMQKSLLRGRGFPRVIVTTTGNTEMPRNMKSGPKAMGFCSIPG